MMKHREQNSNTLSTLLLTLARLDDGGRAIVKKLWEWGGDLAQVAGNKWKRMYSLHASNTLFEF